MSTDNKVSKVPLGKRLARYVIGGIAAILIIFTVIGGFYRVNEQEVAVVTMFGKVLRTDTAGLYFKIPWVQQVSMVDTTTHGTSIGYVIDGDGQEFTVDTDSVMITSDFNLVDIDFYMEYKVADPVAYLYNSKQPEIILKNIALAAIRSTLIDFTVDDAMTTGKAQIQALVKQKMQDELAAQDIGLQIINITVQDAEPPTEDIVLAFKAVETAKQGKDTAINNANKYKNEQIPAAEAEADRITQDAEAQKAARIAEAEGQVARFNAMYEQYKLNPLITKQRLFYETLEEVLPGAKVIITDGTTETMLPLESFAGAATGAGANQAGSAQPQSQAPVQTPTQTPAQNESTGNE
ncbi:MAG: FtsH protease activity modulator HflK [Firmicutes bacterium]|nr:FtsH protease activity modulator HflK [Bacillota bacterium]